MPKSLWERMKEMSGVQTNKDEKYWLEQKEKQQISDDLLRAVKQQSGVQYTGKELETIKKQKK